MGETALIRLDTAGVRLVQVGDRVLDTRITRIEAYRLACRRSGKEFVLDL